MYAKIKSTVSVALLSALSLGTVSAIHSTPAHAIVGTIANNAAIVITGDALGGLTALIAMGFATAGNATNSDRDYKIAEKFATVTFLGVIIMDSSGSASFSDLTPAQADKIGLSKDELAAYENELDELNVVFQDNQAERTAEYKATGNASLENSKAEWKSVQQSGDLSPLAFSAAEKIAAAVTN